MITKVMFEERYFKNKDEWDCLLHQLDIPEDKRLDIDIVEIDIDKDNITLKDLSGSTL